MTTATRTKKIPTITATSTPNFYDVLSSDNKTHYPLLVEGPGRVVCGCPAGSVGRNCYHRDWVLEHFIYIDPEIDSRLAYLEEGLKDLNIIWEAVELAAETEAEKDAYRDMMEAA